MSNLWKFILGLIGVVLIALFCFYGLGHGERTIADLEGKARAALVANGLGGVDLHFEHDPLRRVAHLSGDLAVGDRARALALVSGIGGVFKAQWDGPAAPAKAAVAPPSAPAVPPATPKQVADCQGDINALIVGKTIQFATASAAIKPESDDLIAGLAKSASACAGARITVEGHTDATGNAAANQRLSEARAASVRDALIARGVPAGRLEAKGFGATRPLDPTASPEAYAKNRRIEFSVASTG